MKRGVDPVNRCTTPGTSAVEVLVAVMVTAALGVPMLALLFQERDTEQRSRYEYLALLAARDEMYQTRMAVACGLSPDGPVAHSWKQLENSPLAVLGSLGVFTGGSDPCSGYYPDQKRVATMVAVDPATTGASPRLRVATVTARWADPVPGAQPPPGGRDRRTTVELVFGVLKP